MVMLNPECKNRDPLNSREREREIRQENPFPLQCDPAIISDASDLRLETFKGETLRFLFLFFFSFSQRRRCNAETLVLDTPPRGVD